MWLLTGVVLGSIVSSTHDSEEACRGRKAMLEQVKGINQIECRAANHFTVTGTMLTVPNITVPQR